MEIYFNKEAGKLNDLFMSLIISVNYDYYLGEVKKYYFPEDTEHSERIKEILSYLHPNINKYKTFFKLKPGLFAPFENYKKIWDLRTIDEYINYIENLKEEEIKKSLITHIEFFEEVWIDKNNLEDLDKLIKSEDKLFNYLTEKNLSKEDKWNILYYMKNIKQYKSEFITLIEDYIPTFEKVFEKCEKEINEFSKYFQDEINKKGIYIDNPIPLSKAIDIDIFERIYIFPSYFDNYSLNQILLRKDKMAYLSIGKDIEYLFDRDYRAGALEKSIVVLKNLSVPNRYEIVKLLSQRERYGQELADNLGITSATVSYHAKNLYLAKIIDMDSKENKVYYSINKDTLRKSIQFIQKDLNL